MSLCIGPHAHCNKGSAHISDGRKRLQQSESKRKGAARRGFGRVAEQVSGAAQSAVNRVTPDKTSQKAGDKSSGIGASAPTRRPDGQDHTVATTPTNSPPTAKSPTSPKSTARRKPRKAHLRRVQVDAWSVLKTAFLLSIATRMVTVVRVGIA